MDGDTSRRGIAKNFQVWKYHALPLGVWGCLVVVGAHTLWDKWLCQVAFWLLGKTGPGVELIRGAKDE